MPNFGSLADKYEHAVGMVALGNASRAIAAGPRGTPFGALPFDLPGIPSRSGAAVQPILNIVPQQFEPGRAQAVLLLHQAQGFPDHFARRCIKARRHFLPDHLLKLGGEIDVHRHGRFRFQAGPK
jgi:hypothetical protein